MTGALLGYNGQQCAQLTQHSLPVSPVELGAEAEAAVAEEAQGEDGLLEAVCVVIVALQMQNV